MLCPSPDSYRAVDFGSSSPHPSHSLKGVPPTPATQSTDQEGITIFMLRVTGIRGLQRKQFGCFSSMQEKKIRAKGSGVTVPPAHSCRTPLPRDSSRLVPPDPAWELQGDPRDHP